MGFRIVDTFHVPSKYYVKVVENRITEILLSIIRNVYMSGTIIWIGEWCSYCFYQNTTRTIRLTTAKILLILPLVHIHSM